MDQTDREILGYSRYVVLAAAFSAMFIISPFEYAWSSMSGHIGAIYGWSPEQVALMFTTFIIFQSVGMLPGGMLRDKYGPRWTTAIAGLFSGVGILSIALGPSYPLVLVLWSVGSFFTGFIYNNAVTTGNKWFSDKRGVMAAIIAGVSIVAALLMKDPPAGWKPTGWVPKTKAIARPSEHNYTVSEALKTGQMWVLIVSFVLVSSAGLAGMSNMVAYSNSFHFTATAATAAAGGIALANGFGKLTLGTLSQRLGVENTMILSYIVSGLFLFLTMYAGMNRSEWLFVCAAIFAIFFWASLFSLFPIAIGHYFGEAAAGGNYGVLYAIAKGSGGLYGGILSTMLITQHGFPFAITIAGVMAIVAGLILIPLKYSPPIWKDEEAAAQLNAKAAVGR